MVRSRTGLGRGLGALIPGPAPLRESVDVDLIVGNPYQPRLGMAAAALEELAESIRVHGVLQPLLVTRMDSIGSAAPTYQVIAGERRLEAARLAGLAQVPVIVKETTPREGSGAGARREPDARGPEPAGRGAGLPPADRRVRSDPGGCIDARRTKPVGCSQLASPPDADG